MLGGERWKMGYEALCIFLLTCLFLVSVCYWLEILRSKNKNVDYLYKAVFA